MYLARGIALAAVMSLGAAVAAQAGEISIKGVHLCCGACEKAAKAALADLEGVTEVKVDKEAKTISYTAADEKAAKKGIEKLAETGFHGDATLDKKEITFPESGAKKGNKSNVIVITGVHLCCGACEKGAKKALDGIGTFECDRATRTITLSGKDLDVAAAIAALNKGGFHGTIKAEKK